MTPRLGRRRLATLAGGALALGLIALFVRFVFVDLSITVRAVLLLGVALVMVCWTAAAPARRRDLPAFGMVAALLTTLLYTIIQLRVSPPTLAVLSLGTFVGVVLFAYYVQNGRLAMTRSAATYAVLGIVLVSAAVVGVDLAASDVAYAATLDGTVTLGNDSANVTAVGVGNATATNTFLFREAVDFPDARACIYTGDGRSVAPVRYGETPWSYHVSVAPGGRVEAPMEVRVPPETATAVTGPIPIERAASCPPAGDGPPRVVITGGPPTPSNSTD